MCHSSECCKNLMQVYIVKEGESLSVPCVAGGNPPPAIEWRRGKEVISQNILNLQQVSVHDTGINHQYNIKLACSIP